MTQGRNNLWALVNKNTNFKDVHSAHVLDKCTEFISPTKLTVLNTYEYWRRSSDKFRHKCTNFSQHIVSCL